LLMHGMCNENELFYENSFDDMSSVGYRDYWKYFVSKGDFMNWVRIQIPEILESLRSNMG
jgi:hypothetical protein